LTSIENLVQKTPDRFGPPDILVNNASISKKRTFTVDYMVEALLVYLQERGYEKLTIGEGTGFDKRMKISTLTIYHRLGYDRFIKRSPLPQTSH